MKKSLILLFPVLLFASGAFAANQMKPGLWEMRVKSDMLKQMPKIPPEQMEQMRKMGIEMPQMNKDGLVTRMCITKEMVERKQMPEMNNKETGCEVSNQQFSGNSYSMDMVCDGPQMKGKGKVKANFSGGDRYTSTYDFKGTMNGQPFSQQSETIGKWISTDCGKVAPMTLPASQK